MSCLRYRLFLPSKPFILLAISNEKTISFKPLCSNVKENCDVDVAIDCAGYQSIHRMQIWRTTRSSPGTSHESEASEASVLCFDNASPEKSCFVDGLVCFISQCLLVFVFLNASRRDRDCPTFASTGKQWIHGIR